MPTSFQVKNNGDISVFVTAQLIPPVRVKVLPGETSEPFSASTEYRIQAEFENLPLPVPEVLVKFSAEELFEAKAINRPHVNVDLIAKFDFPTGNN